MKFFFLGILILAFLSLVLWRWVAYEDHSSGDISQVSAPLYIFDFDGTICPSFDLLVEELNAISGEYGFRKIEETEREALRRMNARKIMQELGIPTLKLPFILKKVQKNAEKKILAIQPVPGMVEAILELKARGVSLGVLTSNSEENVRNYAEAHGFNVFDFIYSGGGVFSKHRQLEKIMNKASINPKKEQVFYFGDELRDMEAAQKASVTAVGVSWGYNPQEILEQGKPDYICQNPQEISSF